MSRPRFSEALIERRLELGLSIGQASRILRLREDVLVAFEEGDYEHMPQSGYAQGMLSSYARYLGLNAREIVDLFQEELYEHRHGTSSHELRRRTRQTQSGRGMSGYDLVNEAGSRPKAYVEYRPLLPSSGGPAGDMGYFATTSPARSTSSVPLAGVGPGAPGTRGSYGSSSYGSSGGLGEPRHPYNQAPQRERSQASTARRRATGARRRGPERERAYSDGGGYYRRDDVSTRRVGPSEYTDDMRYDDTANPYAPASTISGRRSSRNIASVERPNVRRRPTGGSLGRDARGRSSRRPPSRGGAAGAIQGFFSDPRRALFSIILGAALVITVILVLSVGSCMGGGTSSRPTGQTVSVNNATQTSGDDEGGSGTSATDGGGDAGSDAGDAADDASDGAVSDGRDDGTGDADGAQAADDEPEETVVEVSVSRGGYSWVEIVCDGTSAVADGITGPWSQSFTVTDSITVQVADTSAVTVTENGRPVDFTSHAGGVSSLTVKGTPLPADDADDGGTQDGTADGADAGTDGSATGSSSGGASSGL